MKLTAAHGLALGMFLTGMAAQLSSLPTWGEATSPLFISGVIMNLGSVIVASASGKLFPPNQRSTDLMVNQVDRRE